MTEKEQDLDVVDTTAANMMQLYKSNHWKYQTRFPGSNKGALMTLHYKQQ